MYLLYYYPSNASMAPHIALEEIGTPFELRLVDREHNAQKSPEYLRLNPNGLIPVLVDRDLGDLVLYESAAICLHLADRNPTARLAPAVGTAERAQCYKWLIHLTNTVQAELLAYFYPERQTDDAGATAQLKRHAERRVGEMMDRIETALGAGGPISLATPTRSPTPIS
jgi:glutathione S-transferase